MEKRNVFSLDLTTLLPLTDPRDAEAQGMLNIPYRIIR